MRKQVSRSCRWLAMLAPGLCVLWASPDAAYAQSTPAVTTLAVTNLDYVNASNALAQCSVNPNGASTTVQFQYSPDLSYTNVSMPVFVSAGNGAVPVSGLLFPNLPNTLFHVRAVASNSFGTTLGGDVTFTNPLIAPRILSVNATNISGTSARIAAQISPRNGPGGVYVVYGTVGNAVGYGSQSSAVSISGLSPTNINIDLGGLQPNASYFYGVVATNSAGTNRVDALTFRTGPLPFTLRIRTRPRTRSVSTAPNSRETERPNLLMSGIKGLGWV